MILRWDQPFLSIVVGSSNLCFWITPVASKHIASSYNKLLFALQSTEWKLFFFKPKENQMTHLPLPNPLNNNTKWQNIVELYLDYIHHGMW
jgi:hypothetical protein